MVQAYRGTILIYNLLLLSSKRMRQLFIFLLINSALLNSVEAIETVRINITHFPPFYIVSNNAPSTGLGIDLIKAMNEIQSDYRFETIEISPRRRHHLFDKGVYDVSLFDHIQWGWDEAKVEITDVYLSGGERYIALASNVTNQTYFNDLPNKKIGAILGYHYNFADFESDPDKLNDRFDITLVDKQIQILKLVLGNRVEVGVITETYLLQYLQTHKNLKDLISVSNTYDQPYNFIGIVRKNGPISAKKLEHIIHSVTQAPEYRWIEIKYGINW
ncbi:substrate-binding periplasmic protein [Kiloniella sp.]|uniref:substrate-binding periplasmic protein n=1 Tax=Kiloniella sp. TaxID=1938587 RepID=UPI003B0228EC